MRWNVSPRSVVLGILLLLWAVSLATGVCHVVLPEAWRWLNADDVRSAQVLAAVTTVAAGIAWLTVRIADDTFRRT